MFLTEDEIHAFSIDFRNTSEWKLSSAANYVVSQFNKKHFRLPSIRVLLMIVCLHASNAYFMDRSIGYYLRESLAFQY
jgi:hypothetical protein